MTSSDGRITLLLQRNDATAVVDLARSTAAALRRRFGHRTRYLHLEEWLPVGRMHEVKLDDRKELGLSFRIAGEGAGSISAKEGGWFKARLLLPTTLEAGADCFLDLVDALSPEAASCGAQTDDYISWVTFRRRVPSGAPPDGAAVLRRSSGVLIRAEHQTTLDAIRAWLTMQPILGAEPAEQSAAPTGGGVTHERALPSYLRPPVDPAAPLQAPPVTAPSPDETVLGASPRGPALPFQGPPPLIAAPPDKPEFDPDVTLPPVVAATPALPFSGTTTAERLQEISGPLRLEPAADAGQTAMLPVTDDLRALVTAALQGKDDLSLEEYATLRALLMSHGEDDRNVLLRFGLTKAAKEKVQQKYFERFRADPALRAQFELLLREELRKHHRMKEDP